MTVTTRAGRVSRGPASGVRRADTSSAVLHATLDQLHRLVRFDAAYLAVTDPETTLFSRAVVTEGLPGSACAAITDNEFHEPDVNKFAALHRAGPRGHVATLDRATGGCPERSHRARTVNRALGLGPELRATFSTERHCWGALGLLRAQGDRDFTDTELALLAGTSRLVTTRLRQATLQELARAVERHQPAGVLTLDQHDRVVSMTDHAAELLAGLSMLPAGEARDLPGELHVLASLARARARRPAPEWADGLPDAVVRVPSRAHGWLTLRAECARGVTGELVATHVVLEQSRPSDVLGMVVASYDLSRREEDVLVEVVAGHSTDEIASRLVISPHTVRDHVKSIFEKTGTRSRGELTSHLFAVYARPGTRLADRPLRSGLAR